MQEKNKTWDEPPALVAGGGHLAPPFFMGDPKQARFFEHPLGVCNTVGGQNPFRTTWKPSLKPLSDGIYKGIVSCQGFLGGANGFGPPTVSGVPGCIQALALAVGEAAVVVHVGHAALGVSPM